MILNLAQTAPVTSPTPTPTPTSSSSVVLDPGPLPRSGFDLTETGKTFLAQCQEHLDGLLDSVVRYEWLETTSFAVAIGLLTATGLVTIWKAWKKTPDEEERLATINATAAPGNLADILKALPELIKALSSAPAAVVLVITGLLLAWHNHQEIKTPPACSVVLQQGLLEAPNE